VPEKIGMQSNVERKSSLVLIVNDHAHIRSYLQDVLSTQFKTDTAASVEEGIKKIEEGKPDVILCATNLRGASGFEFLQFIKQESSNRDLPFILISENETEEDSIPADILADDYLTLPLNSKKLLASVRTQLKVADAKKMAATQIFNLFDQAPVAIAILRGSDFIIEQANFLMLEQWGRTAKEVMGKALLEALPEIKDQGFFELLTNVYQTGNRFVSMEHHAMLKRNGKLEEVYVSFAFEAFRDLDGNIQGVMAIAREVTELVLAQKAAIDYAEVMEAQVAVRVEELMRKNALIQQQKDFAESIINSSIVLISVLDVDAKVLAFNNRSEEAFGVRKEEVMGKNFLERFPSIHGTVTHQSITRALAGETVHIESYKSTINGRYYESFTTPLRSQNGKVYAIILTAHDISIIVESSEKLKRSNEELIRKNDELEQFAYISSHDLQEPLRKIQTFSELVSSNIKEELLAKRYLHKIEQSASRMSALIKAILAYSSIHAGDKHFEEVDLNALLESVKEDFELRIEQLKAVIQYEKLPVINAIPLQIQQLFTNLIGNSLKFCDQIPFIRITVNGVSKAESAAFDLDKNIEFLKIEVQDNGIGFEQEYADKIFTIFQRLNNRIEGTGIGLALCKKIVENHKGVIHAKSRVGEGSVFTVFLPA
jgi:PAS domain S-box-containing protein